MCAGRAGHLYNLPYRRKKEIKKIYGIELHDLHTPPAPHSDEGSGQQLRRKIERFIESVKELPELITEFDESLWAGLGDNGTPWRTQRSGSAWERRSDGVSELSRLRGSELIRNPRRRDDGAQQGPDRLPADLRDGD